MEASMNLRRGILPPESGKFNAYSCSDGAAMRSGPIGIVCAGDPERAARLAGIDASISHYRDGIWGAQAVAVAVSMAMIDASIDEILNEVLKTVPEDSWFHNTLNRAFNIVENANYDISLAWMPLHNELFSKYRAAVPEAVSQAFGVLKLSNQNFKSGVILAGNFGRDADTIGAIVGAILGAKYGASSMPKAWIEKTQFPTGTCLAFTNGVDIIDMLRNLQSLLFSCCLGLRNGVRF
jgi:ADP-ribosylglycohydrolase